MEIKKIKLINGGFKGCLVEFNRNRTEKRNGKEKIYSDNIKEERNNPIHFDLDKPIKELRYFALEICGLIRGDMDKTDIDYTIAECELDALEIDGTSFVLASTKTCLGNKAYKFKTPKVTVDDGYHNYDSVMRILEVVIAETVQYMEGTKEISDEEVALRYIRSGRDKSKEAAEYDNLNPTEKRDYLTKILEGFGSFVTHSDDVVEDTPENNELLSLPPAEGAEFTLDSEEIIIELPAKK